MRAVDLFHTSLRSITMLLMVSVPHLSIIVQVHWIALFPLGLISSASAF